MLWRAFVHAETDPADRAKQAYDEFALLDGRFADNVIVRIKNGALDCQPREPFQPLFGAMPWTALAIEFQITKEYPGFATHLAYRMSVNGLPLPAGSPTPAHGLAWYETQTLPYAPGNPQ